MTSAGTFVSPLPLQKVMPSLFLLLIAQTCCVALSQPQSPSLIGNWDVKISFATGDNQSLRFEAASDGKGSFLLQDPRSKVWTPAHPSEAKWTTGDKNAVRFSGAVEFPIGNVGRDPGILTFTGKFETESLIVGEVDFSPSVGDRPSKSGTFKATRAAKSSAPNDLHSEKIQKMSTRIWRVLAISSCSPQVH